MCGRISHETLLKIRYLTEISKDSAVVCGTCQGLIRNVFHSKALQTNNLLLVFLA